MQILDQDIQDLSTMETHANRFRNEETKTTEPSPKPQQTFSQSDEEWISLLKRADQLICDRSRLSESCRLAGTEIMDVYELLSGYRSRTLNSREIANSRRERESLILGILKRDPEVVTKAGIDNALYSIIKRTGRHWRYSRNL